MSYEFVNSQKDFNALCSSIAAHPYISIDTESNSLYSYHERMCLLQISAGNINAVVDMLSVNLKPILPIFADPKVEKIFHSADSDIRVIKNTAKCSFVNIFDVMIAAKYLGVERCGLDSLVNHYFGIVLDKKYQKADWGKRPLTKAMLDYAAGDSVYLKQLRDIMYEELQRDGKLGEALGHFADIAKVEPHPHPKFDKNGFYNIRGAGKLNGRGLAVLRELYIAREEAAKRNNMPPFKIVSEDYMFRLSAAPTEALENLKAFRGSSRYVMEKHGPWLKEAIQKGLSCQKLPPPKKPCERTSRKMDAVRMRFLAMKKWRKAMAERRNMLPETVLDTDILEKLAFAQPSSMEDLKKIKGIPPEKLNAYGKELLEFFRTHRL
ncbi:MAG: HRDC domain-containing protein [Elusimicrobiales bacterium]|nr:HRDC domain-containing protein [Elusimicrobiales bacterium]